MNYDEQEMSSGKRMRSWKQRPPLLYGLVNGVWLAPFVAAFIVLLFLVLGKLRISEAASHYVAALVYSAFIGVPSAAMLTWTSVRLDARLGKAIFALHTLVLLVTATLGCFASAFVLQIIGFVPPAQYWNEFRFSYPFAIVITLVIGLSIMTYETLRHKLRDATIELRTRQVEQERANKLLAEARLSSLESRIHPHFLFNTLNSIAALIPSDPVRAEDTVSKLASLLRFSLNANHSSLVPLSQELKVVRDYLEIESTRFGPRLRYEIAVPESVGSVKVPPLALQSLVENSVKHVAAQRSEGATIRIAGLKANGRMQLEVVDDGPGFSLASISPEHGLGNLSARLQLLFDEAGQLDVTRENGKTIARISFPAEC